MHRNEMAEDESSYVEESSIKDGNSLEGGKSIVESSIILSSNNHRSNNTDQQHYSNSKKGESEDEVDEEDYEVSKEKGITIVDSKSQEEAYEDEIEIKFKSVKKKEDSYSSNSPDKRSSKYNSENKEGKDIKKNKNEIKNLEIDQNLNTNDEIIDINALYPNEELHKIITAFTLDIIKLADECFDIYQVNVQNRNLGLIDINEVQNLLDVLGIKKNVFEIKNCIVDLKKSKKFPPLDKYNKENFLDIVDFFRNYRIDDKLLVEAYRSIDDQCDGFMSFEDMKKISLEKNLNFSNEDINDILYFFELDDIVKCELQNKPYVPQENNYFNFEKFCKLFYQG